MTKSKAWLMALRLRTLPLSLSGILMGSAVALYNDCWDSIIFTLAMVTTVLFQILSNLANDLGDTLKGTDNAQRIGPQRTVQSGLISRKQMKFAIILTGAMSLLSSAALIYFGSIKMPFEIIVGYVILAVLCIIAAITYTIGKKAYGYLGLGDLMVFIFFGLVSVLGVYSLFAKAFLVENILLAICVGLLSAAVLNLNNMRDYQNDLASKKNTLVVKIGPNQAKLYHALLILISLSSLGVFLLKLDSLTYFICMIPGAYLLYHLRLVMQTKSPKEFDPELKKVALSTFAIAVLFFFTVLMLK